MARLIVCDASALIGWLDPTDPHHQAATEALEGAVGRELGAATLTLAEVLVGAHRSGRSAQAASALEQVGIVEVGLDGHAAELAALRVEVRLPMPDCCVLLAARLRAAAPVLTFDRRLAAAARSTGLMPMP